MIVRRVERGRCNPALVKSALAFVLLVAALVRIPAMSRGLGQDELFTTVHFVEVQPVWRTVTSNLAFNNHIGYSVMARAATALFGRSEWVLRFPALILGLATVPVLFLFARRLLHGAIPALTAAVLVALSPAHIAWSTEARGYSALIFFTLLSSYLYLRLLTNPSRRVAVLFVIANILGIYSHLYAVLVASVQLLFFLLAGSHCRPCSRGLIRISFGAILCGSAILYSPVLRSTSRDLLDRGHSAFRPSFPWDVAQALSGVDSAYFVLLLLALCGLGFAMLAKSHRLEVRYFALLFAGPLMLMCLSRPFDLYTRFFSFLLPYFIVLVVAGAFSLGRAAPKTGWAPFLHATSAAVLILIVVLFSIHSQNHIVDEGYRNTARAVLYNAPRSVPFCAIGGARSVWQYYVDRPLVMVNSLTELDQVARTHGEIRCLYYEAAWQAAPQTAIARYLLGHAQWSAANGLAWFIYKPGGQTNPFRSVVGEK